MLIAFVFIFVSVMQCTLIQISINYDRIRSVELNRHNELRQKHRVPALKLNSELNKLA